jgi:hypothetical protein
MKPIIQGVYTNGLGQELQPGDAVVVIAQGYAHSLRERLGVYLGYRGDGRYKTPVVRVTVTDKKYISGKGWQEQPVRETVRSYGAGRVYKTC